MVNNAALTAVIEPDQNTYLARCIQLGVASQGKTVEQARANLLEAVELFLESASQSEIKRRLKLSNRAYVMSIVPNHSPVRHAAIAALPARGFPELEALLRS